MKRTLEMSHVEAGAHVDAARAGVEEADAYAEPAHARVEVMCSVVQRLKGLMSHRLDERAGYIVLVPCHDIHTYGMHQAIDVAFANAAGVVVAVRLGLPPHTRLACASACLVAERFASDAPWFQEGDSLFAQPSSYKRAAHGSDMTSDAHVAAQSMLANAEDARLHMPSTKEGERP